MAQSPEALERRRERDRKRAKAKNKAYYEKNRERELARCREYHHAARETRLAVKADWRERHRERENAKSVARRRANPEEYRERERIRREAGVDDEYQRAWRRRNSERERGRQRQWHRDNPEKARAKGARRRAAKLQAMPPWVNHAKIEEIYSEAVRLTQETGVPHEVDHFYPLQGRNLCGLHVHTNLRVVTRTVNRRKHNRLEGEYQVEDIRPSNHQGVAGTRL